MDYPVFTEVYCPEVSLNRLRLDITSLQDHRANLRETAAAATSPRVKSLQRVIVRDENATFRTFLFPTTDTYHKELVNSLLRSCHYHDVKPELLLTSFLRHRYRDYRLSSIQRIYYIHRHT